MPYDITTVSDILTRRAQLVDAVQAGLLTQGEAEAYEVYLVTELKAECDKLVPGD